MKSKILLTPSVAASLHALVLGLLTFGGAPTFAEVTPNRTLPKFEPPQAGLRFSAQPTAQEFLRVRLFREALVPIGGEPGAGENQALAKALLEYSQRPCPNDQFVRLS